MQNEILGLQELPEGDGATTAADPMMTVHTSSMSILGDCQTRTIATTW